jgi:lipopolysaccharide/colanic/teichoic acid biosynthesis glycosyltransferase
VDSDLRRGSTRRVRTGEGRPFSIYKFRTMVAGAENELGPTWATNNDPRVTRAGRLLRATRLDELPQLWNVLRGDMSLVGPRPERPHFVNQFAHDIPRYRSRLFAQPGITGLAQVEHQRHILGRRPQEALLRPRYMQPAARRRSPMLVKTIAIMLREGAPGCWPPPVRNRR